MTDHWAKLAALTKSCPGGGHLPLIPGLREPRPRYVCRDCGITLADEDGCCTLCGRDTTTQTGTVKRGAEGMLALLTVQTTPVIFYPPGTSPTKDWAVTVERNPGSVWVGESSTAPDALAAAVWQAFGWKVAALAAQPEAIQ